MTELMPIFEKSIIAGLLTLVVGYALKIIIPLLFSMIDKKDDYIQELVRTSEINQSKIQSEFKSTLDNLVDKHQLALSEQRQSHHKERDLWVLKIQESENAHRTERELWLTKLQDMEKSHADRIEKMLESMEEFKQAVIIFIKENGKYDN